MTSFADGLPEIDGGDEPNVLKQDTLFHLLATSGIAELATSEAVTTVFVDSTPKDTGELYMNTDGRPVYGFMTKFSEGFTGWKSGDLVRARFVVCPTDEEVSLLVADSYVGDTRHADEFVLEGNQEELANLRKLGITELDLDVEVTSEEPEYIVSNMFKHTARIDRVNNILAPWDGTSELEPGQVLIQGRVMRYVAEGSDDTGNQKATYMSVDVNGNPVAISMNNGYISYEGSQYEHLLNEAPETGDLVQVLTTYDPDFEQSLYARPRVSDFEATWCRSTYCLEANPDRAAKQEAFNTEVETKIDELAAIKDQAAFREKYGEIIDLTFLDTGKKYIKDCRTAGQKERIDNIVSGLFSEDEPGQKPLLAVSKDLPSTFSTFKKEFGIDVYSMSVEETYKTVMEIAQDPANLDPKIVNTDGLFRMLKGAITPEQLSTLANTVVETYYPATVRKGLSFDKENYKPEPGKIPYNQHSLTEYAILHLGATGLTRDTDTLIALFEESVENDQFSHKRGEDDYMSKVVDSLHYALTDVGTWSPEKGWHEITDESKVSYFKQSVVPRLIASMGSYTAKILAIGEVDGERYAEIGHHFALSRAQNMVALTDELTALSSNK